MRLITWNCNCAFKNKVAHLIKLEPDIAILQECEKSFSVPSGYHFLWTGDNDKKGLGVLSKLPLAIEEDLANENWTYFLPLYFPDLKIRLLATWAFNHRASKFGPDRIGFPIDIFPALKDWLKSAPSIVAGDFNHSQIWDVPGKRTNFSEIKNLLSDSGLISAYHAFTKEDFGRETKATHFHTKNPEKPYHIDYVFLHESLKFLEASLPNFESWKLLSDHVPLIVDIDILQ